jgi:hypothetical protein
VTTVTAPAVPVPLLDLKKQYATIREEILRVTADVYESQHFILGPRVEAFEKAVASYVGARHAIGMSSGTDAQLSVMMALGVGPGDDVVTSPYTFFSTAGAIARLGARAVFVDIEPRRSTSTLRSSRVRSPRGRSSSSPCISTASAPTWIRSGTSRGGKGPRFSRTPVSRSAPGTRA